jgi:hypothetical protein
MMKVGMENNGKAYQSFAGMLSPGLSFDKKKVRSALGGGRITNPNYSGPF